MQFYFCLQAFRLHLNQLALKKKSEKLRISRERKKNTKICFVRKKEWGTFLQHIFPIKCWKRLLTQKCNPAELEEFLQHQSQIHTVWQFANANSMALYGMRGAESGRAQEMAASDSVSQSGGIFLPSPLTSLYFPDIWFSHHRLLS